MGKYVRSLNDRIQLVDHDNYLRQQYQSFMTGPEWRNVEMAQEFGAYLKDENSMFRFPYFRQILDLWKVTFNSYSAARRHNSHWSILSSEYMVMDVFVSLFTTIELLPKGVVSLLLYPFLKKENPSEMQGHLASFYENYAKDLQTIPFYDHKYKDIRQQLKKQYKACTEHTWVDWFSWKFVSLELIARRIISKPLSSWFHQDNNTVSATTDILVKLKDYESENSEQAKENFKSKLNDVSIVADDLYVKESDEERQSYFSVYARLRVPRYAAFQTTLKDLADNDIHLRKIAGQDFVQVKCSIDAGDEDQLDYCQKELNLTKKVTPLYNYGDRIHSSHRICLFEVPVRNLHKTVERLKKQDEVKVEFIHNF